MIPAFVLPLLLAQTPQAQAPLVRLTSEGYRAEFRASDARLARLTVNGHEMLRSPVVVSLIDDVTGQRIALASAPSSFRQSGSSASWEQTAPGWRVTTEVRANREMEIEFTLRNLAAARRSVTVQLDLAGLPLDAGPFLAAAHSRPPLHPARTLRFGYRADASPIVFPAVAFLSQNARSGVTISSPIDAHSQGLDVELKALHGPFVARRELRAEPGSELRTKFRLSFHEPDSRSALRVIRDAYPEAVRAHDSRAIDLNGSFLWTPLAADSVVRTLRDQGVRWVELIFTAPFIGEFAPSKNPWSPTIDDLWMWEKLAPGAPSRGAGYAAIRSFLERRMPPWMTFDRVRAFIRTLHANDIRAFLYFQPSTAWSVYALEKFPDDVARDQNGEPVPDWLEQIAMNPRVGSAWARHLEEQFRGLLDNYPEADGIFMDQSHFDFPDYAHDDGVTIRGGRPASRMGMAIREITARLVAIARSKGKMVWWNGPWMAEMGAPGDGHLSEASESIEALQYFGLANKPINTGAAGIDSYDRVLLAGAQPAAPILSTIMLSHRYAKEVPSNAVPPAEELALFQRYKPLFEAIRRREWLLEPDAIHVPDGFEANAFRNPSGDAVFPIVTSHAEPGTGWSFDLPIEIRLRDASAIRSARVLTPECGSGVTVKFERNKNIIRAVIPRHRRASVVVLSVSESPAPPPNACPMTGIEAGWIGSHRLYAGESKRAEIFVANHTQTLQQADLKVTSNFIAVSGVPARVNLEPGERKRFAVVMTPRRDGIDAVRLTTSGHSAVFPFYVQKQRIAREAKLLSARLEFEGWIPDGSPDLRSASYADQFHVEGAVEPTPPPVAPREVRVNGQVAGFLPSLNDAAWRNLGPRLGDARIPMQVKLPDAVMLGLERTVRVVFRPSHQNDAYRLRKIALRLRFSDGSTAVSEPLGEFRTIRPGAELAAPIEVVLTLPKHFSDGEQ